MTLHQGGVAHRLFCAKALTNRGDITFSMTENDLISILEGTACETFLQQSRDVAVTDAEGNDPRVLVAGV